VVAQDDRCSRAPVTHNITSFLVPAYSVTSHARSCAWWHRSNRYDAILLDAQLLSPCMIQIFWFAGKHVVSQLLERDAWETVITIGGYDQHHIMHGFVFTPCWAPYPTMLQLQSCRVTVSKPLVSLCTNRAPVHTCHQYALLIYPHCCHQAAARCRSLLRRTAASCSRWW
jgi:hypothetical protein